MLNYGIMNMMGYGVIWWSIVHSSVAPWKPTQDSKLLVSLASNRSQPEVNDGDDQDISIWLIILPVAITIVLIILLVFGVKLCMKSKKGVQE